MRVDVRNFGPIYRAEIEVTPMTVLIGRNNLGKSFISQLIFSLASSMRGPGKTGLEIGPQRYGMLDLPEFFKSEIKESNDAKQLLSSLRSGEIPHRDFLARLVELARHEYGNIMGMLAWASLEKIFGVRPTELVNINAGSAQIILWVSPSASFHIKIPRNGRVSSELVIDEQHILNQLAADNRVNDRAKFMGSSADLEKALGSVVDTVQRSLEDQYDLASSYYLPSGRGGLLDSWDTISTAWVNLAPISIPRGIQMPPLPGTAAMFYNVLHSLTGKKEGMFSDVSGAFCELLGGSVNVSARKEMGGKKDIYYLLTVADKSPRQINIIHAGSMIKEVTPLYLIVRELLKKNDLFIVEEPESHLHPTAQRDLVKIMVGLTARGVHVLFTTHSDVLLRTVAHVMGKSLRENSSTAVPLSGLSIYLLKPGRRGSTTTKIQVGKSGTIEKLPTFDEVMSELYDEEMRLDLLADAN